MLLNRVAFLNKSIKAQYKILFLLIFLFLYKSKNKKRIVIRTLKVLEKRVK